MLFEILHMRHKRNIFFVLNTCIGSRITKYYLKRFSEAAKCLNLIFMILSFFGRHSYIYIYNVINLHVYIYMQLICCCVSILLICEINRNVSSQRNVIIGFVYLFNANIVTLLRRCIAMFSYDMLN